MLRAMTTAPAGFDAASLARDLDQDGFATRPLLDPTVCRDIGALWDQATLFRKTVIMEHHAYGRGSYKYLAYPLPAPLADLRSALYPPLAAVANGWRAALREPGTFPATHAEYLARCHAAGQTRPTPLLLRYETEGFNCLHQDLYGEHVFPLQVVVLLSAPDRDFTGGEFLLVEQRPRAQSKPVIVPLRQGEAAIFPVHHRPARGVRGSYRLTVRHGVSRVRSGQRRTMGLIFHDAA